METRNCVGCNQHKPFGKFEFRMPICWDCFANDHRYNLWFYKDNSGVWDLWHALSQELGDILFKQWWDDNA